MRKNMIKIGVIGMALVFALGVSFNAMAMEPVATVTPVPTKTAVTSKVINDNKPVLTAAEKAQMKKDADANFKKILDYYVGTGAITQADADAAYKLITDSATRVDMSKLPVSVQAALKDLKDTKINLTVAQKTAMKTTMIAFFKVEIQKLVDSNVLPSELAAKLLNHEKGVKVVLTAAQKDAVKAAAIQAGKDTLIKLEKDGTITKAQADKLALLKMGHKGHGFAFGHYKNGNHKNGHNKMMNKKGFGHKNFKGMNSANFKGMNSGNKVNCRL